MSDPGPGAPPPPSQPSLPPAQPSLPPAAPPPPSPGGPPGYGGAAYPGGPAAYGGPGWPAPPEAGTGKNRIVAIVLALFLGWIGIHKFYLGRVGLGILYLIFFWTGIPGFIAWIESILYLATSDETWAMKYGGPIERSNGVAIGCLWLLALLPILSIVFVIFLVPLVFLGGQVSTVYR